MSSREFTPHYDAMKVCCQEKHLVPSVFQEADWSSLKRPRVISGGYINKEASAEDLPQVSFQDTCYLNTGIALLKASEGSFSLISTIHPLLCLLLTSPPYIIPDFSESLQILCLESNTYHT